MLFPGHALHEKGLQRQKGVGTLVSSQERRAAVVPVISRLSTACQPRALFPHRFTLGFLCSCFRGNVQDNCLRCPGGQEGRLCPPTRRRPVLSGPAPPCRPAAQLCAAPNRSARGMSGFWIRQVRNVISSRHMILEIMWMFKTYRIQNPNIPRAGRDGAAHGRTAERGGVGQGRK